MANETPTLDVLKKQLEDIISKMRLSKDATRLLREQIDALKASGTATAGQLEVLTKKLEKQYNQSIKFANEAKRIQNIILKQYPNAPVIDEEKIDRIKKEAAETQKRLNKSFAELRGSFTGETLYFFHKQLQWYLSKAVSIKVLELPADILSSMTELNKAVEELGVLTRALPGDLEKLKSSLISVTKATSFSMTEVGNTAKFLAQSGLDVGQIITAMQPIADLAIATSARIEDAAKAVSTVLVAMDLPANQASKVADILAQSTNLARLNIEDLSTSFNYTAAAAAQLNIPIDKLTAYLAILSNQGLRASTAATGLRQVFETIQAPSEKAIKTLAKYNLTIEDISPLTNDLVAVLQKLSKVAKTDLAEIFSTRGGNAIMALLNAGPQAISQMEANINKQGIAAQMAREQMLTLDNAYKNFINTIQVTQGIMGEKLASPPLVDILTGFSKTLQSITDDKDSLNFFQQLFKAVVDLTTFIGPAVVSFTALKLLFSGISTIFPTLSTGFTIFNAAISGNTNYIKENVKTSTLFTTVLKQEVVSALAETTVSTGVLSRALTGLKAIVASAFAAFKASLPGLVLTGISVAISTLITYFIKTRQELGELHNLGVRISSDFSRLNNEITQGLNDQITLNAKLTQEYMKQYPELVKLNQERAKLKFVEDKSKIIDEFLNSNLLSKAGEDYKAEVKIKLSAAVDYKDLQQKLTDEFNNVAKLGETLLNNLDDKTLSLIEGYGDTPDRSKLYKNMISSIVNGTQDVKIKLKELDKVFNEIAENFSGFEQVAIKAYHENLVKQILAGRTSISNELVTTANTIADHLNNIDSLIKSRTLGNTTIFNTGDVAKYTQDLITLAQQIQQLENDINNTTDKATKQQLEATLDNIKKKFVSLSNLNIKIEADPTKLDDITKKIYSFSNLAKKYTFLSDLIDSKKPLSELQKLTIAFQKTQQLFTVLSTTAVKDLNDSTLQMLSTALNGINIMFNAGTSKLKALDVIKWLHENRKDITSKDNDTLSEKGVSLFKQKFDIDPRSLPGKDLKISSVVPAILEQVKHDSIQQAFENLGGALKTFGKVGKDQVKGISDAIKDLASDIKDLPLIRLVDKKSLNETQYFVDVVEQLKDKPKDLQDFYKHLGLSNLKAQEYAKVSRFFKNSPLTVDQVNSLYEQGSKVSLNKDILDQTIYTFVEENLKKLTSIAKPDFQEAHSHLISFFQILKNGLDKLRDSALSGFSDISRNIDRKNLSFNKNESIKIKNDLWQNIDDINKNIFDQIKKFKPDLKESTLLNTDSTINVDALKQKLEEIKLSEEEINKLITNYSTLAQNIKNEESTRLKILGLQNEENLLSLQLGNTLNQQSDTYLNLQLQIKKAQIERQKIEVAGKENAEKITQELNKQVAITQQQLIYTKALRDIEQTRIQREVTGPIGTRESFGYDVLKRYLEAQKNDDQLGKDIIKKDIATYMRGPGEILGTPKIFETLTKDYEAKRLSLEEQLSSTPVDSENFDLIANSLDSINEQLDAAKYLMDQFGQSASQNADFFTNAWTGAKEGFQKFSDTVAEQHNTITTFAKITENAMSTLADGVAGAITDMIMSGKSFEESFKNIVKNIGAMILQTMLKMMMMRMVAGMFGGFSGSSGTISESATFNPNNAAQVHSLNASLLKTGGIIGPEGPIPVMKYATGGIARKTQVAVFGEGAMPEAFVPLPNGRAIPVQMKGAASVTQTNIQIIDQRKSGADIQTEKTTDASGNELIKVFIRDEVRSAVSKGQLDDTFSNAYGVSRVPIRR